MTDQLEFRALGPFVVTRDGNELDLGPRKQRSLLMLLLANANRVVSTDRIIDALWGEDSTGKENALHVYISRLRSALEPGRQGRGESSVLLTKEPGYVLVVDPEQIDLYRFEKSLDEAREVIEADPARAVEVLDEALGLWRGEAMADFAYEDFLANDIGRVADLRLEAEELRFDAMLRLGHAGDLVSSLESFARQNPYRERPVGQLMVALYRAGRQTEALRAYERHRRILTDELGIDPSPELRRLEEQILLHDNRLAGSVEHPRTELRPGHAGPNPYKGLHAFNEADESQFFGRETLIAELLRRLGAGDGLVALVGPSGSGKSSVVRAGVIPRVRKGALSGEWVVAQMVPGAHPFTELEVALLRARLDGPDNLTGQLAAGDQAILRAGLRVLPEDASRLLLVIDQFEELFTLAEDRDEQRRFLEALLVAIDDPHSRIRVVLTLRADFYDRPLLHPAFGARLGKAILNVTPLSPNELEEAALQPAVAAGVHIEATLLARLLADILDQPGALPMFQYTLTELYERRSDDALSEAAYEDLGGVRGAITNRAEELYQELSPDEQAAARQLFLRLVAISDSETWSRRRVRAAEIISLDLDVVTLQAVIDRFGKHRLLLFDRDEVTGSPTVEVGHEALLREWPRLESWIRDARADLVRHAAFTTALEEWERSDRDPGFLATGARLAEYERWATSSTIELNTRELDFLGAAIEAREADIRADEERAAREMSLAGRARRRLWAMVAAIVALVAVVAVVLLAASDPKPRVALIQAGDSVGAGLATLGLEEAEARFGVEIDTIRPPWTSVEAVQNNLAESGTDLILIDAALDLGAAAFLARSHPDTKFAVYFNLDVGPAPSNYVSYVFADEESAYLAGVAAALETATGTIGFVGAYPVEDIRDRLAGFQEGARSVDPDIEVLVRYLNDDLGEVGQFNLEVELLHRPDMGKAAALEHFAAGADIVFHAAGDSGLGVFEAAHETTAATGIQVWGIGSDTDQYFDLPVPSREHVLMSTVRRIDAVVLDAVEMVVADQFQWGIRRLTLGDGGVDYAASGDKLAPTTIDAVEAAKAAIIAGHIVVQGFVPHDATVTSRGPDESGYGLVAGGRTLTAAGINSDVPLYRFEDGNGSLTGFEVELLDEIARRLGLDVQHADSVFQQIIPDVAVGKYDVSVNRWDITPQRQEIVAFTSPYLRNPAVLVVHASSSATGMADVATVAVGSGTSSEDVMRSSFPEVELIIRSGRVVRDMLEQGEVDGWVTELTSELLAGDESLRVVETVAPLVSAFVVNPALTDLLADMNAALADMIQDGTYGEIFTRWLDTPELRVDLP